MAGGLSDELGHAFRAKNAVFGLEALGATVELVELELGAEDGEEAGVIPGLLDEVGGAAAHGFNGEVYVGPCGHDDDGKVGFALADGGKEVEALLAGSGVAGVVEVEEAAVELLLGEAEEDFVGGAGGFERVAFGAQEEVERVEDVGLVVGDEESAGGWHKCLSRG